MQSISIIGIGRMGGALALALSQSGYQIDYLVFRNRNAVASLAKQLSPTTKLARLDEIAAISSDIVLITSGDNEIENIAREIIDRIESGTIVLHTSGSLASDVLSPLRRTGAKIGSLHPLVSVSDPIMGSERFSGSFFCSEGDVEAVAAAGSIVESLGGRSFSIETRFKPLYHASAVMASGNVVALFDAAIEMLSRCGLEKEEASAVLFPLIRSTIENLEAQTPADALTGPFARADVTALERHLASFNGEVGEHLREIYLLLAERSLDLAERRGTDAEKVELLRSRISIAKRNREC